MKRKVAVETEDIDSGSRRMSDHEVERSPSISITSEEVARQIDSNCSPVFKNWLISASWCKNSETNKRKDVTKRPPPQKLPAHLQVVQDGLTRNLLCLLFKSFQKSYHKPTKTLITSKLSFLEAKMRLSGNV